MRQDSTPWNPFSRLRFHSVTASSIELFWCRRKAQMDNSHFLCWLSLTPTCTRKLVIIHCSITFLQEEENHILHGYSFKSSLARNQCKRYSQWQRVPISNLIEEAGAFVSNKFYCALFYSTHPFLAIHLNRSKRHALWETNQQLMKGTILYFFCSYYFTTRRNTFCAEILRVIIT